LCWKKYVSKNSGKGFLYHAKNEERNILMVGAQSSCENMNNQKKAKSLSQMTASFAG